MKAKTTKIKTNLSRLHDNSRFDRMSHKSNSSLHIKNITALAYRKTKKHNKKHFQEFYLYTFFVKTKRNQFELFIRHKSAFCKQLQMPGAIIEK